MNIYKISRGYKQCRVWIASPSHVLVGTSTLTPDEVVTRRGRYNVIATWLRERFGIKPPSYRPLKREPKL